MPGTLGTIELTAGVLLVLEGLGARVRPVDLEEVGVASFQMAPDLFAMKRYPEYPRLDTVYYALKDLKKKGHVAGSLKAGWTLTSEGNVWLKKNQTRLSEFDKQGFEGNRVQNAGDAKAELRRIKAHPAFQDYASGQRGCPSRRAIAEILRCTAGSKQSAFRASLERFLAYAEDDDPAVLEFLIFMKNSQPWLFGANE